MKNKEEDIRLAYVLDNVKRLQLRFPVAEIARKTGFHKGNVSAMLSGKIPISDNFLKTFIKEFNLKDTLNSKQSDVDEVSTSNVDVGKMLGELEERIIAIEGLLKAMLPHLAAAVSTDKAELISMFQLIQQQGVEFSNMIFDERKRKHKP